jgi:hypothetical protein
MDNLMGSKPFSMSYRKGEITPRIIDRDFLDQVELRADLTTCKNHNIALEFCRELSLAPRGLSRRTFRHFTESVLFARKSVLVWRKGIRL